MAKRFTDTEKWKRPWYRKLPIPAKLAWNYILDNCDHCGVWTADFELLSFQVGIEIERESFEEWFADKVVIHDDDKYFIPSFIEFQYGQLKDQSAAHRSVLAGLKKYGIHIDHEPGLSQAPRAIAKRLSRNLKFQVLVDDLFVCTYCGVHGDESTLQVDHIVPRIKGGTNHPDNLTTSCIPCNSKKSDLPIEVFLARCGELAKPSERLKRKLNTLNKELYRVDNSLEGDKDKDKYKEKVLEKEKEEPTKTVELKREDIQTCITSWQETLTRYQIKKKASLDEAAIGRLIQQHGFEKTELALKGMGYEQKTDQYDPAKHCRISRLLKPDIFELCVNLGAQHQVVERKFHEVEIKC